MKMALLLAVFVALPARAGLRPQYGGELVVEVPSAPVAADPWRAWNVAELAVAVATTLSLSDLGWSPEARTTSLPAKDVAAALTRAISEAPVSLPPISFRADGDELVVTGADAFSKLPLFSLPWLRVAKSGPFAPTTLTADATSPAMRPYVDDLRLDVKTGRRLKPDDTALLLAQSGAGGRFVFALPRPGSDAKPAIDAALAKVDRASLAKLFLRGIGEVPDGWPLPKTTRASTPPRPLVIAVDDSERDAKTIADRLQVLMRDRHLVARIVAEPRDAYFARLAKGDYDLALVALPTSPGWVEAATLAKLANGDDAAKAVWSKAAEVEGATPDDPDRPLRDAARETGAVLLYREGGGVARGARVELEPPAAPWLVDFASAWLLPASAP